MRKRAKRRAAGPLGVLATSIWLATASGWLVGFLLVGGRFRFGRNVGGGASIHGFSGEGLVIVELAEGLAQITAAHGFNSVEDDAKDTAVDSAYLVYHAVDLSVSVFPGTGNKKHRVHVGGKGQGIGREQGGRSIEDHQIKTNGEIVNYGFDIGAA